MQYFTFQFCCHFHFAWGYLVENQSQGQQTYHLHTKYSNLSDTVEYVAVPMEAIDRRRISVKDLQTQNESQVANENKSIDNAHNYVFTSTHPKL